SSCCSAKVTSQSAPRGRLRDPPPEATASEGRAGLEPVTEHRLTGRIHRFAAVRGAARSAGGAHCCGGVQRLVRVMPAARPLLAITSAILREASSIISSPSIAAPRLPPSAEVYHS